MNFAESSPMIAGDVPGDTVIATWFVADDQSSSTFFPQVGGKSSEKQIQDVYWRCVVGFYFTSVSANPGRQHLFFTNSDLPMIDGHNMADLLSALDVEVVRLPITYRLPPGRVSSWGNQFYIFDIIAHLASRSGFTRAVVLDSDCVWTRDCRDLEREIDRAGIVAYELGPDEHPHALPINGRTREQLAAFARSHSSQRIATVPYCGGEFFAASRSAIDGICRILPRLWEDVFKGAPNAPLEEAHLLSVIYALGGHRVGTGCAYIKRMWTTFHHRNSLRSDVALMIWHLPAEKKTGFFKLFGLAVNLIQQGEIGSGRPTARQLAKIMGIPHRCLEKFVLDASAKICEHFVVRRRAERKV